jgi:hypothetical protein
MPPFGEGVVLVVLTLCGSFAVFELVRRVGVLRPLFGLGARRDGGERLGRQDGVVAIA